MCSVYGVATLLREGGRDSRISACLSTVVCLDAGAEVFKCDHDRGMFAPMITPEIDRSSPVGRLGTHFHTVGAWYLLSW